MTSIEDMLNEWGYRQQMTPWPWPRSMTDEELEFYQALFPDIEVIGGAFINGDASIKGIARGIIKMFNIDLSRTVIIPPPCDEIDILPALNDGVLRANPIKFEGIDRVFEISKVSAIKSDIPTIFALERMTDGTHRITYNAIQISDLSKVSGITIIREE